MEGGGWGGRRESSGVTNSRSLRYRSIVLVIDSGSAVGVRNENDTVRLPPQDEDTQPGSNVNSHKNKTIQARSSSCCLDIKVVGHLLGHLECNGGSLRRFWDYERKQQATFGQLLPFVLISEIRI